MSKYKEGARIATGDFYYDITRGGYIKPSEILVDQDKARSLQMAADLLMSWEEELIEDDMIEEL